MDESGLLISLLLAAFMFVLGWLVGIERNNKLTKDLEFWKAYARELDKEQEYRDYGLLPDNPIVMEANSGGLANLFRVKNQ